MSLSVWGDDGDPVTHGRDTALYQELVAIHHKYTTWLLEQTKYNQFWSPDHEKIANDIDGLMDKLREHLNTPL